MRKIKYLLAALSAIAISAPAAANSYNGGCTASSLATWMTADVAARKAEAMNLDVQGVFTVGSYYEVHAADKRGRTILAYFDPLTGKMVHTRAKTKRLGARGKPTCIGMASSPAKWVTADDIYKKAEAMSLDVRGVDIVGSFYEVHAIDANGRRVLAYFDPLTGKIVSTRIQPRRIKPRGQPAPLPVTS